MAGSALLLVAAGKTFRLKCCCGADVELDRAAWERAGYAVCPACRRLINYGPGLLVETPEERQDRIERIKRRRLGLELPRHKAGWGGFHSPGWGDDPPF